MKKQSAGTYKVKQGEGRRGRDTSEEVVIERLVSTLCLQAFQQTAMKRGFERSYQF